MPSTTLQAARRALARSFDDLGVYALASSTTSAGTSAALVNATANASSNRFDGAYVYAVGTAEQRRVRTGGYNAGTGTLTIAPNWASPAATTEIEVTRLLPVKAEVPGEEQSWSECVRRAAAKLLVPDRVAVAIAASESIPLAAYPWLDRPERLLRVLEPPPTGTRPVDASWRNPGLAWSAGAPSLELDAPFDVALGSLTLEVLRPADTLIGGVETAPGTGPTTDSQTVPAGIEELVVLGTLEACTALQRRNPGRPGAWEAQEKAARERAEAMYHFDGAFYRRRAPAEAGAPS